MRRAALLHRRLTALFQPQKISVDVKTATDTVQLHSLDIKIKDVCAVLADASVVKTAPKGPISLTGAIDGPPVRGRFVLLRGRPPRALAASPLSSLKFGDP